MITGNTLLDWGIKPGPHFKDLLAKAKEYEQHHWNDWQIHDAIVRLAPKEPETVALRTNAIPFDVFLDPETEDEKANYEGVIRHMDALMRTPTLVSGAVMPDACPSGTAEGTIPVGGVVAARDAIHPGMHSADICCSMAITVFKRDMPVESVLNLAMGVTHFGGGHRKNTFPASDEVRSLIDKFGSNQFLKGLEQTAFGQLGTQGDGNHFFYVGHLKSTGELAIVTHHGSRNVGGQLYRRGMAAAQRHTAIVSPRTPSHNAWIDANSDDGRAYWEALQLTRLWTKANHFAIHDVMQQFMGNKIVGRFWNEHNFVFRKDDLYYHAKGSTPAYDGFSPDDTGQTLIPLNMGQPILITDHVGRFVPHGAGRNLSRTSHMKRLKAEFPSLTDQDKATIIERETKGIDVRFFFGNPDLSELPSAYKRPEAVRAQIEKYHLGNIVDEVLPAGTIMAGDLSPFWRKK